MRIKRTTNKEKLECLSRTFLTNHDISVICDCGIHKAMAIRKKYKEWAVQNHIEEIDKVFTDDFIEFYNLNLHHIREFAKEGM